MLSPVSYDGAPTPPPQPSPHAWQSRDPMSYQASQIQQAERLSSPRNEMTSSHRIDGVQSQRSYDHSPTSRHMNGGYSSLPTQNYNEFSTWSRQSPQQIRKDNIPSLNITAKSLSTPNVNMNNKSYGRSNRQDEDLAIAR